MADEQVAQRQDSPPADSTPAVSMASTEGVTQSVSAPTIQPQSIPFDQNPELQDYINRQVERRLERHMQTTFGQKQEDITEKVANELTEELQLDGKASKAIVQAIRKVSDHVAEQKMQSFVGPMKQDVEKFTIQQNINAFAQTHGDFGQYQDKMIKLFYSLSPEEQNFIKHSRMGVDLLYSQVKVSSLASVPQGNRFSGTSPGGSGTNKLPEVGNPTVKAVSDALVKGDKDAYNKAILALA